MRMPLLAEPAVRAPITVGLFERAFSRNHPSITYGSARVAVEGLVVPGPMPISVRTLTGKTIQLRVQPNATTKQVKLHICAREGIPWDEQRLVHGGRQLDDKRTLLDCGVAAGAELNLVLKLCGD